MLNPTPNDNIPSTVTLGQIFGLYRRWTAPCPFAFTTLEENAVENRLRTVKSLERLKKPGAKRPYNNGREDEDYDYDKSAKDDDYRPSGGSRQGSRHQHSPTPSSKKNGRGRGSNKGGRGSNKGGRGSNKGGGAQDMDSDASRTLRDSDGGDGGDGARGCKMDEGRGSSIVNMDVDTLGRPVLVETELFVRKLARVQTRLRVLGFMEGVVTEEDMLMSESEYNCEDSDVDMDMDESSW